MPFDVVLADPSWSFNDKGSRIAPDNEACADGYQTSDTDAISKLKVSRYCEPNAALFLWTTWTHLLEGDAASVIKEWGFVPKVVIPWVKLTDSPGASAASWTGLHTLDFVYNSGLKIQVGAGHYTRACTEPLILATRGSMVVDSKLRVPGIMFDREISSPGIIAAPRPGGHSTKPTCVYELIEHLYPRLNYLELYARRTAPRGNWTFIGDQKDEKKK